MSWHTFTITPHPNGAIVRAEIQRFALADDIRAQLKSGVGVFTRRDPRNQDEHFYFTPDAVTVFRPIIDKYDGMPCAAPAAGNFETGAISLLLGDMFAQHLLAT